MTPDEFTIKALLLEKTITETNNEVAEEIQTLSEVIKKFKEETGIDFNLATSVYASGDIPLYQTLINQWTEKEEAKND